MTWWTFHNNFQRSIIITTCVLRGIAIAAILEEVMLLWVLKDNVLQRVMIKWLSLYVLTSNHELGTLIHHRLMIVVVVGSSVAVHRHLGALPWLLWLRLHLRVEDFTCCVLIH